MRESEDSMAGREDTSIYCGWLERWWSSSRGCAVAGKPQRQCSLCATRFLSSAVTSWRLVIGWRVYVRWESHPRCGQLVCLGDQAHPPAHARCHSQRSEEHTSELQSLMRISY